MKGLELRHQLFPAAAPHPKTNPQNPRPHCQVAGSTPSLIVAQEGAWKKPMARLYP
jgi:hypothetical protein